MTEMNAPSISALEELVKLVEDEATGETTAQEPDDESIGWDSNGPLPMTFGHIRRARAELDALAKARGA